ncbi:MAG: hypothetical protein WHS64_09195 [Fervidobacterium sp.]|uniref:Uncharacterized protein n=1 Tax=Fervidobacterium gondwanense DSM 13020 TaxID=1121883 RepID=A0A1M7TA01_FERGO|nr:hypothetical protein [Fervidobacterium gondwanense]SHN67497.1 hypothetical protein SAMN02745226_01754 [Fervidobacterium gondwanense DSM 13020]
MYGSNEEDKLKNIMKLKEELEKDLKKKGLLKDKKQETSKSSTVDESTMKRLKESVVKSSHIVPEESLTLYNINLQDYDASIEDVIKALRIFSAKTTNMNHKLIFEGLVKLLEGNVKGAKDSFTQAQGIEAQYNKILSNLYSGEDVSQELALFLKSYPDSIYPLLLILEREIIKGTADGIEKILSILSKRSYFWHLIFELFKDTYSEEAAISAVREKVFASLIMLLFVYIDRTKDLPIQNHTCLNAHKSYLRGETISAPDWCPFGRIAIEARRYLAGYKIDFGAVKPFEKTPEGKLFLGLVYLNEGNKTIAEQYINAFEKQVGDYKIYKKHLKQSKMGIEQFIALPSDFEPVEEKISIIEFVTKNPGYDIYVRYRKFEFVRLVFSEEHCKINYSK